MSSYIQFFGLKEAPFNITPDVEYFFSSTVHQEALMSLNYLLDSGEGFYVLTGEPGMGKTFTIRKFLSDVDDAKVEYAYIIFPNLTPEELFMAILEDFGIEYSQGKSKNWLFSKLKDFLLEKRSEGKKIVFIVDEAQNLPIETLEELRVLSNLETEKEKLIHIVLSGQTELEDKLNSESLRQLKQRITLYSKLTFLSIEEMESYIKYRLAKAGESGVVLINQVIKKVYKATHGNPRLINLVMERVLMAAFVDGSHTISVDHVDTAMSSLNMIGKKSVGKNIAFAVAGLAAAAVIAFAFVGKNKDVENADNMKPVMEKKAEIVKIEPKPEAKIDVKTDVAQSDGKDKLNRENVADWKVEGEVSKDTIHGEDAKENIDLGKLDEPLNLDSAKYDLGLFKKITKEDIPAVFAKVTVMNLNVRRGPSTEYEVVDSIDLGTNTGVIAANDLNGEEWAHIVYVQENEKRKGWVSMRFIKKIDQ